VEIALPKRQKERIDKAEAKFTKSKTEIDDPNRDIPYTEMLEPNLRNERMLMELPKMIVSNMLRLDPNLVIP
jgi:hypothetical protein